MICKRCGHQHACRVIARRRKRRAAKEKLLRARETRREAKRQALRKIEWDIHRKRAAIERKTVIACAVIFQMHVNGASLPEIAKAAGKPKRWCQESIDADLAGIEREMGRQFDPHGDDAGRNPHTFRLGGMTGVYCTGCDLVFYTHGFRNGKVPCGAEPHDFVTKYPGASAAGSGRGGAFFSANGVITCAACCEALLIARKDYAGRGWTEEVFEAWRTRQRERRST